MTDVVADYVALRQEAGAVWLPRDVLRVAGPDARAFLQGQLSQEVEAMPPRDSRWSLLLQPTGKVDALLRVTAVGDDELVLDTDEGWGDAVATRLRRFLLRTKAEVESLPWRCLALRGPLVQEALVGLEPADGETVGAAWPGGPIGVDLLGADPAVPAGVRECGLDAWEAVRIESGIPKMGAELTTATIPAEAGQQLIDATVSFTKGCFVGQELVARIDSRGGHVPRHLRGVVITATVVPPVGAAVVAGDTGKEVGTLTSVAESLERRSPVALAYVARSVEPPADVVVRWDGGEVVARVEPLPLVP
jgi:folate-binding protein YgfZ